MGKVINHYKMAKHFTIDITEDSLSFCRNHDSIAAAAALDGIYVLRTSLPADTLEQADRGGHVRADFRVSLHGETLDRQYGATTRRRSPVTRCQPGRPRAAVRRGQR